MLPTLSLKKLEYLIDRIHDRYPFLTKHETIVVISTFFSIIRESLINNLEISISELFSHMRLIEIDRIIKSIPRKSFKIKLSTSKNMKNDR